MVSSWDWVGRDGRAANSGGASSRRDVAQRRIPWQATISLPAVACMTREVYPETPAGPRDMFRPRLECVELRRRLCDPLCGPQVLSGCLPGRGSGWPRSSGILDSERGPACLQCGNRRHDRGNRLLFVIAAEGEEIDIPLEMAEELVQCRKRRAEFDQSRFQLKFIRPRGLCRHGLRRCGHLGCLR